MQRLFVAAALLLLPAAGHAQQSETPAAPPATQADAPIVVEGQKEKKVCRTETSTGSIMPRRICKTQAQIAREQADAQRALETARTLREGQDLTQVSREAAGL